MNRTRPSVLRSALLCPAVLGLLAACDPSAPPTEDPPIDDPPPGWLCEETELDGMGDIKSVWRNTRPSEGVVLGERGVGTGVGVDMSNEQRFDQAGRLVYEALDLGADGSVDLLNEWTYDDAGVLRESLDDWTAPVRSIHEYDDAAHEVRRLVTNEETGAQRAVTFENDAQGLPLTTCTDQGADGSIESESHHLSEYDGRDRLSAYWYALTADGQPFEGNEFVYDDDDQLVQQDWISELDSPERYLFSYDELGRLVEKTQDYGPDGDVDVRWLSKWCDD